MDESFTIREVEKSDRNWIAHFLDEQWGSTRIVSRGQVYLAHLLSGFIAEKDGEPVGLITYSLENDACEIVTLDSILCGKGVGTALIEAVKKVMTEHGCKRIWLITTNDNLNALRFYQKRGFVLAALHPNALSESRKLKPEIPLYGLDGIPLRDEIELHLLL